MSAPPNLSVAGERGLLTTDGTGIYTFSNGTEWECWASSNCFECRHYELEGQAGEFCAFEGASMLQMVSPEMAALFGWVQDPKYAGYKVAHDKGERQHGWDAPDACRFFRERTDDGNGGRSQDVPHDPAQLVLLADPTEDIALAKTPVLEESVYVAR